MKLARHEINAKQNIFGDINKSEFEVNNFCNHPVLLKRAEYQMENSAVIEWSAKIHQITSLIYNSVLFKHEKYAKTIILAWIRKSKSINARH